MAITRCPTHRNWRRSTLHIVTLLPMLAIAQLPLTGCGPRSDKLEVSGTITLDGTPLDSGSIRLTSTGSEKLLASGAMVQNGEFNIPQEKGLAPGSYHVEISSPDMAAPLVAYRGAPGEPTLPPTAPERIPAEYNTNSTESIEVTVDGDNHFNFDIISRPTK